jgi:DNA gyrase subunit B
MPKAVKKAASGGDYNASSITVLEGLEPVRKRPGMYIGSTGPDGLHHLVWEIFDNARDEAMAGHCDRIEVAILPGNSIRVVDNGRGIPVDKHPKTGVSALETIMTVLHAGGKFGDGGYSVSGGLHGVGASVVNALSTDMMVEVHRGGFRYVQQYKRGKKVADTKKMGATDFQGTVVTFTPDSEIFTDTTIYNFHRIVEHLREQAYLAKSVSITTVDAREHTVPDLTGKLHLREIVPYAPSQTFYFEGGISAMVSYLTRFQKPIHEHPFHMERQVGDVNIEIALRYVDDVMARVLPFANHIYTAEGGMHVTGFKSALTRVVNAYNKEHKILKDEAFQSEDIQEGVVAVVTVKMPEIQFEGQTKGKLGSPEARTAVESAFSEAFSTYLEENPDDAKAIVNKAALALRARKAAKAAKDSVLRKGALEGFTLPGKLADCQVKDAESAEVFIVEGDSAGGSSKQGRDRRTQAILPLRGKILNVERVRIDRMLASQEIRNLVIAMGASIGDTFDLNKMRYHKIIIATDADVDGAHIRTLLLTLFYRYFRAVIDAGYLYIAQPPLYKIKKGKEVAYAYSDDEKALVLKSMGVAATEILNTDDEIVGDEDEAAEVATTTRSAKVAVQRYKGLGEMNPEELWETTMDPARRVLKQVTVDDGMEADRTFDALMGNDVDPRKAFIQSNAKLADVDFVA